MLCHVLSAFSLQLSLPATLEVPCTSTLPLQCFLSTSSLFGDPVCAKNGQVCSNSAYKMIDWLRELAICNLLISLVSSSYKCSRGFPWISCLKATQCCTVKFLAKVALKYVTRSYLISVLLFFSLWRTLPNAVFEVSRFAANWWTAGVAHWTSTVSGNHNSRSVMLYLWVEEWMVGWIDGLTEKLHVYSD